jgi:hypothetical protein
MTCARLTFPSLIALAVASCASSADSAGGSSAPDAGTEADAGTGPLAPDAGVDGDDRRSAPDGGVDQTGPDESDGAARDTGAPDAGAPLAGLPGWSVRKRLLGDDATDVVLEEVLAGLGEALPGQARIRMVSRDGSERSWAAPAGSALSDLCRHPSGAYSAVLIAPDRTVSLQRLSADLLPAGTLLVHDPLIATDPHVTADGALDLRAHGLTNEAAQIAAVDEGVVAVVSTSWNSVIAYRAAFTGGSWTEPQRTLIEPPAALTPFLPIGGSFDTFGAMVVWFRPLLDVDEAGNAYVAIWASPGRIRTHVSTFHDGLAGTNARDSDVLVTRMDRTGVRAWSRVVGTVNEDEPYALRARAGSIAVAGRARRAPGFDNTTWDAFLAVVSSSGQARGARVVPLQASGIFLAIDALPSGGWVLGGSDGWSQNPEGLSVLAFGTKVLVLLAAIDGPPIRAVLPAGPRHNEVRTVLAGEDQILFGGHEDGPIMHTGDGDPRLIVARGVLGQLPGR